MLDAVALLRAAAPEVWTAADHNALLQWSGEFITWSNSSSFGALEQNENNNHAVWYDAQLLSIALHVGTTAAQTIAADIGRLAGPRRVAAQVASDGHSPQRQQGQSRGRIQSSLSMVSYTWPH